MRRDIRIMAEELAAVSQNIGAVFKKVGAAAVSAPPVGVNTHMLLGAMAFASRSFGGGRSPESNLVRACTKAGST